MGINSRLTPSDKELGRAEFVNYPTKEQRQAFLDDLQSLIEKHGVGLDIGGYDLEIDFVPATRSNLWQITRNAIKSIPSFTDGWDDVLRYGPDVLREIRAQTAMGAAQMLYEDVLTEMLNTSDALLSKFEEQS